MIQIGTGILFFLFSVIFQNYLPAEFQQLTGLWQMQTSRGPLFEEWNKPCGDSMAGRSYKIKGSDTILLESVSIKTIGNNIFYVPTVQDQNNRQPVFFKLISQSSNSFVFENKEHDFPQRIIYRFVNNDSVVARIEGIKNGVERHSEFYYGRVK